MSIALEQVPALEAAPTLDADAIHVWMLRVAEGLRSMDITAATNHARDRLVCAYAGLAEPPTIERGKHGKPFASALPDIDFNASHAGSHIAIAFAREQPLGIDIESTDRRIAVDDIAARYFAPEEARALSRFAPAQRQRAFVALWTRKEAVLKAIGEGLSFGLDRVAFEISADGDIGQPTRIGGTAGAATEWQVLALDFDETMHGAVAWHGPVKSLRMLSVRS